jgi:DNA repair protein RadA/Sms
MAKTKTQYVCQSCGAAYPKWSGQCADCQEWNVLVEERIEAVQAKAMASYAGVESLEWVTLDQVSVREYARISLGMEELDRVMGGGLVQGSVTLIGGDPGIGKSSLLLQVFAYLSQQHSVLYVSGEESLDQIALRARRMGLSTKNFHLVADTHVRAIIDGIKKHRPQMVVIDSIQTMQVEELTGAPGGVTQVRESAALLTRMAKQNNVAVFLVGHVTKSGEVAGPRVLEHIVDTVIYLEGQQDGRFRLLRALKNRFGPVNELGVFAMTDKGLKEVKNPSAIFLSRNEVLPGSCVVNIWEGTRPMLLEVQALVDDNHFGAPKRLAIGYDLNRLNMLLAILHKHGGVEIGQSDVFVNVVGGVKISETSADLGMMLAILSSFKNKVLPQDLVVFGEVGLSGEIRPVPYGPERLAEAAKHGFKQAIISKANYNKDAHTKIKLQVINNIRDLIALI